MDSLNIEATDISPKILFDIKNNVFDIIGKSRPENVRAFYQPVLNWLDKFEVEIISKSNEALANKLIINLVFEYFNSSSAKFIFDIISKIHKFNNKGIIIEINWFYDEGDDEMLEAGEELSKMIAFPFNFQLLNKK
ncbi:MAG: DUF1987 domain-containing protein [Bacteroidota bacterium]|nr:DUF1987 domain-containing protein [Bacteroidota bacterium]